MGAGVGGRRASAPIGCSGVVLQTYGAMHTKLKKHYCATSSCCVKPLRAKDSRIGQAVFAHSRLGEAKAMSPVRTRRPHQRS